MNAHFDSSIRQRLLEGAILLLCVLVPLSALAQGGVTDADRQRVHDEVGRTERLIEEVAMRVLEHDAPEPRDLLERAVMIQKRAVQDLSGVEDVGLGPRQAQLRLRNALNETRHARDLASRAARKLREILTETELAQRRLEEAKRWLARSQDDSQRAQDPRLEQATRLVDQAELRLRDGQPRQTLRLLQNARALFSARAGEGELDEDRLRAGLTRGRELLERIEERGDAPRRAQRVAERVRKLLEEAEVELDAGRLDAAGLRLEEVRRLIDQVQGPPDREGHAQRLEQALGRLEGQIERLSSRMPADPSPDLDRLLERARQEHDAATRAFEAEEPQRAARHLRTAADVVARLQRRLSRSN